MSSFLHQRPIQNPFSNAYPISPPSPSTSQRPISIFTPNGLIILLSLMLILGVFAPWSGMPQSIFSNSKTASPSISKWRHYSLADAASFVAKNGTIIVCAVSHPYLPFLNNWLISITRQKHQEKVLVIAEDYATLDKINEKWPGHAVWSRQLLIHKPPINLALRVSSILQPGGLGICCKSWSSATMLCIMMLIWCGWEIHSFIWKEIMMFTSLMT